MPVIKEVFVECRAIYGSPRITSELRCLGHQVGRHRVARLMRQMDLITRFKQRYRRTRTSDHGIPVAENHLDRRFVVESKDSV